MGTYQPKVYMEQGGDKMIVESGGEIEIKSGGNLSVGGKNVSAAELSVLDGITASAAELSIMHGVTATTAEISKLHGAGAVVASGTAAALVTNAKADYTTGDLDSEAEIISALNAANGKLNSILAALKAFGIILSS